MTWWFLVHRPLLEGEAPLWPQRANNQRHCSADLIKTNNCLPLRMLRRALPRSHYLLPLVLWELRTFCGSQIVPTCVLNNNLFLWKRNKPSIRLDLRNPASSWTSIAASRRSCRLCVSGDHRLSWTLAAARRHGGSRKGYGRQFIEAVKIISA